MSDLLGPGVESVPCIPDGSLRECLDGGIMRRSGLWPHDCAICCSTMGGVYGRAVVSRPTEGFPWSRFLFTMNNAVAIIKSSVVIPATIPPIAPGDMRCTLPAA